MGVVQAKVKQNVVSLFSVTSQNMRSLVNVIRSQALGPKNE